jgi:hypothetical protein
MAGENQNPAGRATQNPPDGNPNPNPNPTPEPVAPAWVNDLISDPALKGDKELWKFKDVGVLAQSYRALQKDYSGRVPIPDGKDPVKVREFYTKLGVPEKADGYKFTAPTYPAEYPADAPRLGAEDIAQFNNVAHSLNLTPSQAQGLLNWAAEQGVASHQQIAVTEAEAVQACETTLKQEWGATYQLNQSLAKRTFKTFGDTDLDAAIRESGIGNDPRFVRAFARIGKALGEEGLLIGDAHVDSNKDALSAELRQIEGNVEFISGKLAEKNRAEFDRLQARRTDIYRIIHAAI